MGLNDPPQNRPEYPAQQNVTLKLSYPKWVLLPPPQEAPLPETSSKQLSNPKSRSPQKYFEKFGRHHRQTHKTQKSHMSGEYTIDRKENRDDWKGDKYLTSTHCST